MKKNLELWWQWGVVILTILLVPALIQVYVFAKIYPENLISLWFKIILSGLIGTFLLFHTLTWVKGSRNFAIKVIGRFKHYRWLNYVLLSAMLVAYFSYTVLRETHLLIFSGFWFWLVFFLTLVFLCGWVFHFLSGREIWETISIAGLYIGTIQEIIHYLPNSPSYPFTLNWSETSWFYYASFFFSKKIYNASLP